MVVNCFQFVIWRSLTHQRWIHQTYGASCELLSICDLTIFDTPPIINNFKCSLLWIAFNLWFDDLWHTLQEVCQCLPRVVNCFQFVIWRSLTHPTSSIDLSERCCELLSICDLTIFDTPHHWEPCRWSPLWIAFNLWFDDLWHTKAQNIACSASVVNCFQFVIWRSLTHRIWLIGTPPIGCELLSICDLTIFDTPLLTKGSTIIKLWIAFNLWFDDLWHTIGLRLSKL